MRACLLSAALLSLLGGAAASADEPKDALLLAGSGPGIETDLTDDVGEAVTFALGGDKGFRALPKEKVQAKIGYLGPNKPGDCLFDTECLRKVHKELGTRWFVVVRLSVEDGQYRVVVTRIADQGNLDVAVSALVPRSTSDLINKLRALVGGALAEPMTMLTISINEKDALVEANDVKLGQGSISRRVRAGSYRIRVSKAGFTTFEATISCVVEQPCVVPATIFREQTPLERPTTASGVSPTTKTALVATGWAVTAIGVGMLVTGAVFGARSTALNSELAEVCPAGGVCTIGRAEADQKVTDGRDAAKLFNAVGIPGIVLAVGGLAMALTGHLLTPAAGQGGVTVTGVASPGFLGLQAEGRF